MATRTDAKAQNLEIRLRQRLILCMAIIVPGDFTLDPWAIITAND
jgi:hypothetical protein